MVEVVSATRLSEEDFWNKSALGISLCRFADDARLITHIAYENKRGLSSIYNDRIGARNKHDLLVFIHDDVWIDDYFFIDRIIEGCEQFDIIGIAGNQRRIIDEFSWLFIDQEFTWDSTANLSGCVAHGDTPFGEVTRFGVTPAECELLDGVFMAASKNALTGRGIAFDPVFDFHFYDLDFCRTARQKGLKLGTWPICLTHQSAGAFSSPDWMKMSKLYRAKWPTSPPAQPLAK